MPKRSTTNTAKEKECTEECQSHQHANELISAITLPLTGILDKQLASYFKSRCSNFAKLRDNYGRSLLHMAASCGRRDLTNWLIKTYAGNINFVEIESGYTALHRSILYGFISIAVDLIQHNASLNIKDKEDLCPLDMLLRNVNLLFVDYILYTKFPQNYDPYDPRLSKYCNPEIISANKSHKKRKTDYDKFISLYKDKLSDLNRVFNAFATEVYTWGTNLNYTSGFASARGKSHPEFLEFFEKKNEVIIEIIMQKFHTLFVSLSGNVWSCGIGHGGRLGLSSGIVLIPERISLTLPSVPDVFCISAASGQDHSIFLCNENRVFVCGTNTYHQLGISPPPVSIIEPVQVNIDLKKQQVLGVAASDFHSVVWTNSTVFTCGLHAGQLGHRYSENTISTFRKVPTLFSKILTVTVSRAATVVATDCYIHVLTNYSCFKIELRSILKTIDDKELEKNHGNQYHKDRKIYEPVPCKHSSDGFRHILKLVAIGGELNPEKMKSFSISPSVQELQIAVVLRNGSLYLWRKRDERLLRCYFFARYISVTNVIMNSRGMWISTRRGEVLRIRMLEIINFSLQLNDGFTSISHYTRRNLSECTNDCYILEVEKVESSFRAVSIFSDPKGDNFAMLQHRSAESLVSVHLTTCTLKNDMITFYRETKDVDLFHDTIFKVKGKSFPAHKYILASCSEQFLKLEENDGVVVIDDISPEVFETILEFAYTGFCRIRKHPDHNSQYEVLLRRVHKAAETFRMNKLKNLLETVRTVDGFVVDPDSNFIINREVISVPSFNRLKFSSLYDIKLRSLDGAIFHAHKCILVAKVEYFKNMLSGNWIESSDLHQSYNMPFTSSVLNEVLEYLYTDKVSKSAENKDVQFWSSLLMAADQFLLTKLKEFSESVLSRYLNVRNVVDLLIFADLLNANQLKTACFEFICINLSSILFFRYLDKINDQQLDQLTLYYRNEFRNAHYQKFSDIPVHDSICDIDKIFAAEQSHPVDWDVITDSNLESDELITRVDKAKPKTKLKKLPKSVTPEIDRSVSQSCKKIYSCQQIATSVVEEKSVTEHKLPEEEWVAIHRQMKVVKSRLKVNAAVRECPQLIEQKENFIPLKNTNLSSNAKPLTDFELDLVARDRDQMTPSDSNYSMAINFSKLTPRVSQAERKRLRRVSESSKVGIGPSFSEGGENTELTDDCSSPSSPSGCWKVLHGTSDSPTSFSSIVASEMKQKTNVMKETRKIVMKSLHSTQTEEQAIQELMIFYNVKNVDEEHITVQRVTHEINAPQWVTK